MLAVLFFFNPIDLSAQELDRSLPGDKIEEIAGRGLIVRSNPGGAKVFIDGIERGQTPLRLESIRPGRYIVRLEKEGYSDRWFRVSVRSGSAVEVSLELKEAVGMILLKMQGAPGSPGPDKLPLSGRISIDGKSSFDTALELPVGFRTIQIKAFGWEDFSTTVFIEEDTYRELELNMTPAAFRLSGASISRLRFNPANAGSLGTTAFNFEVSSPGRGTLTVKDEDWNTVFALSLGPFETWSQTVIWDGRTDRGEILGDGSYTAIVEVKSIPWDDSNPVDDGFVFQVFIDSARSIHPLSISSGKSGLLYAPLPALLPTNSFQIEGSLMAGSPPESDGQSEGVWESLPFAAAFRFSPLEQLEVSAALNVMPRFKEETRLGIGGSAKWAFINPGEKPFGAAAGLSFSWVEKSSQSPFGMGSGIELFFPFMINAGKYFSFVLCPAALWTGEEGFPLEPAPRLLVSGGVIAQMTYFSAGLSIRQEYNFNGGQSWPPSIIAGGEVKIFPPPSSFVFSLLGGIWSRDNSFGGFGGLGIGMIH